jgi:hypothetical protein
MHLSSHTTTPIGAQRVARRTACRRRRNRAPGATCRADREGPRHRPRTPSARYDRAVCSPQAPASATRQAPASRAHRSRKSGASMRPIGAASSVARRSSFPCPLMPGIPARDGERSCMRNASGLARYRARNSARRRPGSAHAFGPNRNGVPAGGEAPHIPCPLGRRVLGRFPISVPPFGLRPRRPDGETGFSIACAAGRSVSEPDSRLKLGHDRCGSAIDRGYFLDAGHGSVRPPAGCWLIGGDGKWRLSSSSSRLPFFGG